MLQEQADEPQADMRQVDRPQAGVDLEEEALQDTLQVVAGQDTGLGAEDQLVGSLQEVEDACQVAGDPPSVDMPSMDVPHEEMHQGVADHPDSQEVADPLDTQAEEVGRQDTRAEAGHQGSQEGVVLPFFYFSITDHE